MCTRRMPVDIFVSKLLSLPRGTTCHEGTLWLRTGSVHWLPVKQRMTYNILLLTFRALNGLAPIYIVDMLHRHRPARVLQSANNNVLQVPSTSSRYGDRAFDVSAPCLWNALPCELKIATSLIYFKSQFI